MTPPTHAQRLAELETERERLLDLSWSAPRTDLIVALTQALAVARALHAELEASKEEVKGAIARSARAHGAYEDIDKENERLEAENTALRAELATMRKGSWPLESVKAVAEIVTDERTGDVLWVERYPFKRTHAVGESFVRDYVGYEVRAVAKTMGEHGGALLEYVVRRGSTTTVRQESP